MKITLNPQGYKRLIDAAITYKNYVAEGVKDNAKELAPVRTGNLRDNIVVHNEGIKSRIVSEAEYGIFVELGTRHQSAQPYLIPALINIKNWTLKGKNLSNYTPKTPQLEPILEFKNNN